jgi:hypothetical protein
LQHCQVKQGCQLSKNPTGQLDGARLPLSTLLNIFSILEIQRLQVF